MPLFLSIDAANKKGTHYMVKRISFWDECLEVFELDADACEGNNSETTVAVNHSMQKIDGNDEKRSCLELQLMPEAAELKVVNRIISEKDFTGVTCSLHALNLMIKSPIEKFVKGGGVALRNVLQFLYTAYSLQESFNKKEFRAIWEALTHTTYGEAIVQPVLTRWEYVGKGTLQVLAQYKRLLLVS